MAKAILFDLDETLIDVKNLVLDSSIPQNVVPNVKDMKKAVITKAVKAMVKTHS